MLMHTRCPIDGSDDADVEVYPANFDMAHVTPEVFSARRTPDRMHYRMVRNTRTGCLRADPVLDPETVLALYRESTVTEPGTAELAADTYEHYLKEYVLPRLPGRTGALEIGCGHGAFLQRLRALGFDPVWGIEPSLAAAEAADAAVKPHIVPEPLRPGLFEPGSFPLICGFQVLDHLLDPNETLGTCRDLLVDGGAMFWICHDIGALISKILGRRCPMIDIEHVVLYDRRTLRALFEKNGFEVVAVFGIRNRYPLSYWARLAPLPEPVRRGAGVFLSATGLGRWQLAAGFGNMGIVAVKNAVVSPHRTP